MNDLIDGIRSHQWYRDISAGVGLGSAPTMLSLGERMMLHWLTREMPLTGRGCAVDAGCFLGGSTLALATSHAEWSIHSYDMFVAPNDAYSLTMIGDGRLPGVSTLDLFRRYTQMYQEDVLVHQGDFLLASPPDEPIDILFLDLAKTRDLNRKALREFFPLMVPGRSILIQQDYNDHSCSWIKASMHILREYFLHLADEGGSRVYMLLNEIPRELLEAAGSMPISDEREILIDLAAKEDNIATQFFIAVSAAWPIFETQGVEEASRYLSSIKTRQPWDGDSYADIVIRAMMDLRDCNGLKRYHDNFFSPLHP